MITHETCAFVRVIFPFIQTEFIQNNDVLATQVAVGGICINMFRRYRSLADDPNATMAFSDDGIGSDGLKVACAEEADCRNACPRFAAQCRCVYDERIRGGLCQSNETTPGHDYGKINSLNLINFSKILFFQFDSFLGIFFLKLLRDKIKPEESIFCEFRVLSSQPIRFSCDPVKCAFEQMRIVLTGQSVAA